MFNIVEEYIHGERRAGGKIGLLPPLQQKQVVHTEPNYSLTEKAHCMHSESESASTLCTYKSTHAATEGEDDEGTTESHSVYRPKPFCVQSKRKGNDIIRRRNLNL